MGLLTDRVPFAVDLNPDKVGTFMRGSKIPICSKDDLIASASTDDLLLLANPNYLSEIKQMLLGSRIEHMETISL